jgi:hypothetical protein
MRRNDKIALTMMVIVVVAGAAEWLRSHPVPSVVSIDPTGAAVQGFVGDVQTRLAALPLDAVHHQVIDQAIAPVDQNPFQAPPALPAVSVTPHSERLRYTGYIQLGGQWLAIVNGREYRVGESVWGSDWVVQAISPEAVEVQRRQDGEQQRVPLERSEAKGEQP